MLKPAAGPHTQTSAPSLCAVMTPVPPAGPSRGGQCRLRPTDGVCNWLPPANNLLVTYRDEQWHASINKGVR